MTGAILGMRLSVEETVAERRPATRKAWETSEKSLLLIIGSYCMGFDVEAMQEFSKLRVFIDHDTPQTLTVRLFGAFLGPVYARWWAGRLASDAAVHFQQHTGSLIKRKAALKGGGIIESYSVRAKGERKWSREN